MEIGDKIARDANIRLFGSLMDFVERYGVKIMTNARCVEITREGVIVDRENLKEFIKADSVLYAVGMTARREIAESFREAGVDFIKVGDCVKPGKVMDAVHGGYFAARNID